MKLFEKVKNMFTEEVEEEVKVEQVPTKVKKENIPDVVDSFEEVKIEKEEVKKPVFFSDHDFEDMNLQQKSKPNVEPEVSKKRDFESRSLYHNYNDYSDDYNDDYKKEPVKKRTDDYQYEKKDIYRGNQTNVYNDPYKEKKEERVFKPTPIISPVYGILDKNYHKEDIVSKQDNSYKPNSASSRIDTIRQKAYGTLEDELENTLFGGNSILFNKKEEENKDDFFDELEHESKQDLMSSYDENDDDAKEQDKKIQDLEEITMDIGKELNTLLNKKENIKKEEKVEEDDDDLFNLIDTMYEEDD